MVLVAGNRRIVDYTADPVNGFNAVVRREPAAIAARQGPAVLKVATPFAPAERFTPSPGPYGQGLVRIGGPVAPARLAPSSIVPYGQGLVRIGGPVALPAQPQFAY